MKKAKVLEELGFRKDWIYETLISTYSGVKAHSAPMGISTPDHERLSAEVYKTSETCANILSKKGFAVNMSSDMSLFYDTYLKKESLVYGRADKIDAPILAQAEACIEVSVRETVDLGDKIRFTGMIVGYSSRKEVRDIKLINRGDALVLEALVAATKIPSASAEERVSLVGRIKRISRVVSRVAPGSSAEKLVNELSLRL
jgi:hypothetical protein